MTFASIGQKATALAKRVPSEGGTRPGKTDVAMSHQHSSEIAAWLSKHTPADMDRAAESRALSHGVGLEVRYEGRYPSGPNGERLPSYTVAVGCDVSGSNEQRLAAFADLEKFQAPADIRTIEGWLAELSVLTAGKGVDGISAELLVTAYSSRLSRYPADVVKYALIEKSWKWFPTWAELEKVCDSKAGPRRHMIAALMQPAPDPEPKRRPPTQEEKDRIAALIAEKFPNVPQSWRDAAEREVTRGNCFKEDEE